MVYPESIQIRLSDGYEAHARLWLPKPCLGAVLYLHGIQSHGLWFEASARRLAEAGLAVLMPDRRGSGRNQVDRGHAGSARQLQRDVTTGLDELHIRTGLERFHLVGVSWGGKLALASLPHVRKRIASLTLIAPGLFPRVDLPIVEKVKVGLSALAARRTLFEIPLGDPALFTANPERRAFIEQDDLRLKKVTAAFLLTSQQLERLARTAGSAAFACPVRTFLGSEDRIIDNTRTERFIAGLGWPECRFVEYDHAHHTLEFEPDPEPFFNDLVDWVMSVEEPSPRAKV